VSTTTLLRKGNKVARESEDDTPWASIVAFDPGGTTGWCVMCVEKSAVIDPDIKILDNIYHWAQGQISGDSYSKIEEMCDLVAVWSGAPVLTERFTLRKFVQGDELLLPHDINFMLGYICSRGGLGSRRFDPRPFTQQQPDMALRTATDARLKDWGLYLANGEEHARDATRHAITLFRRAKEQRQGRLRKTLWPRLYGVPSVLDSSVRVPGA